MPTGDWLWPALWLISDLGVYGEWPLSGEIDLVESRGNVGIMQNGVNIGAEQFGATLHFGTNRKSDAWRTAHYVNNSAPGEGFNQGFHVYELEWTPGMHAKLHISNDIYERTIVRTDHFQFSLDGDVIGIVKTCDGYFKRGRFSGVNPWLGGGPDAPFDREFFIILNVAAGGTSGYFGDGLGDKPWHNSAAHPVRDFWLGRKQWLPTWNTDRDAFLNTAMRVESIRVYAI